MSTEREQRQETEEKIKTFGGSNVKHGLGNRVLGWTGQGVEERDQGWTPGSRRREEIQGASLVCRPRSFWRTWRGMASTGGPRKGPRMGGPCREHPGKPQSTGARREREDPAGSTLESLRAQGQTRAGGPCREHPGKPQSTGPDASVLLPPRKRTRAPGIQDDAGPRLQGKAWPAPGKALSSLKSPASQAQAHCPDKPLPQNWTCEFRVPAWWVRASAWFTANAASWWEGWGALSL